MQAPVADSLRRTGRVSLCVTFRTGSADLDIAVAPVLTQVRDAMVAEGRRQGEPIADNTSEAGRSLNRRVEALRLE